MLRSDPFETPPAAAPQDKLARLEAPTAALRLIFLHQRSRGSVAANCEAEGDRANAAASMLLWDVHDADPKRGRLARGGTPERAV